jgi:hypothetical protein
MPYFKAFLASLPLHHRTLSGFHQPLLSSINLQLPLKEKWIKGHIVLAPKVIVALASSLMFSNKIAFWFFVLFFSA